MSTADRGYGRASRAVGYRRPVTDSWDAIVIGLGGIGSAAAYRMAASPGAPRVLGLEQFELGHDRGASQDVSRITRYSYHRRDYVDLAIKAQAAWRDVEAASGAHVITLTGGLDIQPPGGAESVEDYATALSEAGVPFEWLDDVDVVRRWPQWRLDPGTRAVFQANGGIADPDRGNPAHQELARAAGADLRQGVRVTALHDHAGELEVVTEDAGTFTAGAVVVAADAWTNDLLAPLGAAIPLRVTREQVTWFEAADPAAFAPERFPIWIWLDQPGFYGFPTWRGPGPKVGEDIGGRDTTAQTRTYLTDPDCLRRVQSFLERHLPGAAGNPVKTKTCLYTLTPDRDFVVDRLRDHPGVIVALGAAHAYKFAALFGVWLAELALDPGKRAPAELGLFSLEREGLRAPATNLATTST
jgi:sarcosine oxidase